MEKIAFSKEDVMSILDYYEASDAQMQKQASVIEAMQNEKQVFRTKVAQIVDIWVNRGEIPQQFSEALKADLGNNPVKFAETMVKKAFSSRQSMGTPSGAPSHNGDDGVDAMTAFAMGGRS